MNNIIGITLIILPFLADEWYIIDSQSWLKSAEVFKVIDDKNAARTVRCVGVDANIVIFIVTVLGVSGP